MFIYYKIPKTLAIFSGLLKVTAGCLALVKPLDIKIIVDRLPIDRR